MSRLRRVKDGSEGPVMFDGMVIGDEVDEGPRELTEAELAALKADLAARDRVAAQHVATSNTKVRIQEIEGDPVFLAVVEVELERPCAMRLRGIRLRRWRPDEAEARTLGAPPVCVEFGKSWVSATEPLKRALAPKILSSWESHERGKSRARFRVVAGDGDK